MRSPRAPLGASSARRRRARCRHRPFDLRVCHARAGRLDNLGTGAAPTSNAFNAAVYALTPGPPGVLYAGGAFTDAGGDASADHIAQWSSGRWASVSAPALTGAVNAIAYRSGKLYVGGVFTNAGGNPNADFLAVWDGRTWGTVCTTTGPAIGGNVSSLQIVGSTIYIGGMFQNGAGIASADYLLACDLSTGAPRSMVAKDGEFNGPVYALTADTRGNLYAAGRFSEAGRRPRHRQRRLLQRLRLARDGHRDRAFRRPG